MAGEDGFLFVQGAYVVSRVTRYFSLFEQSLERLRKRLLSVPNLT